MDSAMIAVTAFFAVVGLFTMGVAYFIWAKVIGKNTRVFRTGTKVLVLGLPVAYFGMLILTNSEEAAFGACLTVFAIGFVMWVLEAFRGK